MGCGINMIVNLVSIRDARARRSAEIDPRKPLCAVLDYPTAIYLDDEPHVGATTRARPAGRVAFIAEPYPVPRRRTADAMQEGLELFDGEDRADCEPALIQR